MCYYNFQVQLLVSWLRSHIDALWSILYCFWPEVNSQQLTGLMCTLAVRPLHPGSDILLQPPISEGLLNLYMSHCKTSSFRFRQSSSASYIWRYSIMCPLLTCIVWPWLWQVGPHLTYWYQYLNFVTLIKLTCITFNIHLQHQPITAAVLYNFTGRKGRHFSTGFQQFGN